MTSAFDDPDDMPDVLSDDAPTREEVTDDSIDRSVRIRGRRWIGADYDGMRYCIECINIEYLKYGIEDPYRIPFGGPLPLGSEVDCPGSACANCGRLIDGETLLHYEGVCGEYCPKGYGTDE